MRFLLLYSLTLSGFLYAQSPATPSTTSSVTGASAESEGVSAMGVGLTDLQSLRDAERARELQRARRDEIEQKHARKPKAPKPEAAY